MKKTALLVLLVAACESQPATPAPAIDTKASAEQTFMDQYRKAHKAGDVVTDAMNVNAERWMYDKVNRTRRFRHIYRLTFVKPLVQRMFLLAEVEHSRHCLEVKGPLRCPCAWRGQHHGVVHHVCESDSRV